MSERQKDARKQRRRNHIKTNNYQRSHNDWQTPLFSTDSYLNDICYQDLKWRYMQMIHWTT